MQLEFRNNRDFWAGAMLIATGGAAIYLARDYAFGTALRMGPGYFPSVLGGLMILFGVYLLAVGAAQQRADRRRLVAAGAGRAAAVAGAVRSADG